MNLFTVRDTTKNVLVAEGFKTRKLAKAKRNKLNPKLEKVDDSMPRYVVSRGPDHWRES